MIEWQSLGIVYCEETGEWYKTINGNVIMNKFKVGDLVELKSGLIEGVITEALETNGKTLYKVLWDKNWTYDETEIQLLEENWNGN